MKHRPRPYAPKCANSFGVTGSKVIQLIKGRCSLKSLLKRHFQQKKKKSNTITDACTNLYQSPVNLVSKADHKPCSWNHKSAWEFMRRSPGPGACRAWATHFSALWALTWLGNVTARNCSQCLRLSTDIRERMTSTACLGDQWGLPEPSSSSGEVKEKLLNSSWLMWGIRGSSIGVSVGSSWVKSGSKLLTSSGVFWKERKSYLLIATF